ncbi:TPA: hypothetical protein OOF45_000133 [Morganella morganii]|nr:hypothetical protein [Morganella morganii]
MEFKGTPGPWEITDDVESNRHTASNTYHHIGAGKWFHDDFSNTGFGISGFMSIHDAKLIAAAPDLLDALIKIVEMNQQYAIDKYGDVRKAEEMACVRTARAAINKALGRE